MSDSVTTSKRQRVADLLREYAEMVRKYHGTDVHGKEREYVTVTTAEMLNIADQIDREHERRMREQYARGYEDGMRSMDAEHYAVAIRLMRLPLDEDSNGNLSQIAGAIWHSDFGWTQGACRALRDELVRLMGGVHDEPLPNPCRTSGEPGCEATITDEPSLTKSAEIAKSDADDGGEVRRITDELRNFVADRMTRSTMYVTLLDVEPKTQLTEEGYKLIAIADHMDEQFERICEQQETVLQSTIERMADENITVKDERDYLRRQRDELQAKLDEIKGILDGR